MRAKGLPPRRRCTGLPLRPLELFFEAGLNGESRYFRPVGTVSPSELAGRKRRCLRRNAPGGDDTVAGRHGG